ALLAAPQVTESDFRVQRDRVAALKEKLATVGDADAKNLLALADFLVRRSVWLVGGDGWAYDIGYGGLDHVLASGRNVNGLLLDTQGDSNTRWPSLEGNASRGVGKIRRGGQKGTAQGPRDDGDRLRQCLCRAGGHGR